MERAIRILQKELDRLNYKVQYESNRQVGNDWDESISQIKKAIKTLSTTEPIDQNPEQ